MLQDRTNVFKLSDLRQSLARAVDRTPVLLVIAGGQAGRTFKLSGAVTIGRSPDASVCITDDGVSRLHAEVVVLPGGSVVARDLESTNGTFCNGTPVTSRQLEDGDKLQFGTKAVLKFTYQDAQEEDFQRRMYESATRDGLTGCFNKRCLLERLEAELSFAERHAQPLALAMLDIDHFKAVNDTYGHQAGDQVLREVAQAVQHTVRTEDLLARYGGEEFALVMRNTTLDRAYFAAERLRQSVEALRVTYDDRPIRVTVSVGVTVVSKAGPWDSEVLICQADAHLYAAKRAGRNRTEPAPLG